MVQKKLGDYGKKSQAKKPAAKPAVKKAAKPTGPIARRVGYTVHVREHYRRPRNLSALRSRAGVVASQLNRRMTSPHGRPPGRGKYLYNLIPILNRSFCRK